jgi:prepilin-type N-terminal cleavage/methylation domain-containing protein
MLLIKGQKGVTLIELMIVVTCVAILAAVAIPAYNDYITRSRRSDAFTALETIRAAQEMYRAERGFYVGIGYLAGCSSGMAGNNYTITVTPTGDNTATTFTVTATPQNKQAGDFYFQLDQNGTQGYSSNGSTWYTDKKWEELKKP